MSKGGGSAPQPVDPYQQAAAQYGLSTGTAAFNAALNRPNVVNPLGSSTWGVTGFSGGIPGAAGGGYGLGGGSAGLGPYAGTGTSGAAGYGLPYGLGSGAPRYTQTTQLAPQFQSVLNQPIDTSQIPGMPGGPSLQQNVSGAQQAAFNQQMGLLAPYENQLINNTQSNLAAQGATPGSPAYNWGMQGLGLMLGPQNAQVANQAYLTGLNVLPTLYGLGSTSLQNQINARNAPLNEFLALQGQPAATAQATTPDIANAFNQQYQGQLNAYNAQNAANNATWGDISSLGGAALLAFALSDRRAKTQVKRVGELDTGEGVYTYRYKGQLDDGRTHMGVMAQEIEKDHPEAVFSFGGVKAVNYGAI